MRRQWVYYDHCSLMTMNHFWLLIVFFGSLILTHAVCRYALAKQILDVPNHRSSHHVPTPRGGGVAFIVVFLAVISWQMAMGALVPSLYSALFGAGTLVALLGIMDDHGDLSAKVRLLGHFIASVFALYCLGGMPALSFFGWTLPAGCWLNILAVFYLVWLLNLYNFMDGIDGLAGLEVLTVTMGGVFLYVLIDHQQDISVPLVLAAAVAGFLWWNLPPARIFMGDAGSGFLGLVLGIFSIQAAMVRPQLFASWLILLGVFIVDATTTLVCRLCQGHPIDEAHREHAYQHAAAHYGSHLKVTLGVAMVNLLWLLPMAVVVGLQWIPAGLGVIVAYLPLMCLAMIFKAGKKLSNFD